MDYQINTDRLLDHYYENFHPSTPIVLPLQYLALRRLNRNHGLEPLLSVLHWIGSFYAAATSPEAYYEKARQALCRFDLPRTPLSVQALLLFALGQQHYNLRPESRVTLHSAIAMALELGMNTRGFASQQGEGNPILEESYRRTYYFLHLTDQHFSVISSSPIYRLRDVEVTVDLPCDDEMYEFGQIPPPSTWQDYHSREFAEIEVIYSSMTYLFDIASIVRFIMQSFMKTGTFDDALVSNVDTKLAIWNALLPACKRDPLRPNGKVDEVMFTAHMMATVLVMNTHRPFSSLVYCIEELSTKSFTSPVSFVEALRKNKGAHTARALKSLETETQLLAIPCNIEKHHVFNLCMVCSLTMAQVSACNTLLDDHALSIARDRIRLSIGFISAMSSTWPIAKEMAKEVKAIARKTLLGSSQRSIVEPDPATEIEIPRDELLWPIDTSTASIDIFSGIVLPAIDWDGLNQPSSSSALP
ncbi:hypothetical protein EJ04DRAFT_560890 [Polyplosphaeria fusca]|uniref:Xylanolytic transcriptional activator regulatory domain-containing protein n=1 Tax=Polyplosphaeria fusca TaxID=682080 RepID=A0A9P4R560_9PLEO|nr:hypothetical protein EJ04DRAFT_560890 [Polyplosphaeria fusca]